MVFVFSYSGSEEWEIIGSVNLESGSQIFEEVKEFRIQSSLEMG